MNIQKQIDDYIASQPEWQKVHLIQFRTLLHKVLPEIVEDWKWSVPVFLVNNKVLFAMSTFKEHTKYNFFAGASLSDPHKLFNNGLDSKKHRSIDLRVDEKIDLKKLEELIMEAVNSIR